MKNKILAGVILGILFISLGLNVWFLVEWNNYLKEKVISTGKNIQVNRNGKAGEICGEQEISSFNDVAKKYDYEKINQIYKDIISKEKHESDIDCMTILTISNLYLHRNEDAKQTYEKMKKLVDEGGELNRNIQGVRTMEEFKESVYRPENIPRG